MSTSPVPGFDQVEQRASATYVSTFDARFDAQYDHDMPDRPLS